MSFHVSLPQGLEKRVYEEVAQGRYGTASEVVHEALQRFFLPHSEPAWIAPEMRRRVMRIEGGQAQTRDANAYFNELEHHIQAMPE